MERFGAKSELARRMKNYAISRKALIRATEIYLEDNRALEKLAPLEPEKLIQSINLTN